MKLVGYCRVSTGAQRDEKTIGIQTDALKEYVSNSGDELVETFLDEGVSGALENRPGLALLFACLDEHPEVRGVLIYKLDRLARDLLIQETLIGQLAKRDVQIVSTKEPDLDSNDPTRVMIRQLFGMISQYEKALIAMRLSAGRLRKAAGGGYSGGGIPIGYSSLDKDLVPDQERQEVVKLMFQMRSDGKTMRAIMRHLNEEGVPPPRNGRQWWPGAVSFILNNPIYSGTLIYKGNRAERSDLALRQD